MNINILKYGYGSGNILSLINSLRKSKSNLKINFSNKLDDINKSEILILPGVGSFDYAMNNLKKNKIDKFISKIIKKKEKKILGICLGMQILFESSEEGKVKGLSIFKGNVKNINHKIRYKTNFGWHQITTNKNKFLNNKYFYFAHSYYVDSKIDFDRAYTIVDKFKITTYIKKNNVYGVQFHPEKSSSTGLEFFNNFLSGKI